MKVVLTIAGSDSSGGAGIQADLKTFEAFGVFGTSAITVLTAQNTTGVQSIFALPLEFIAQQIHSVLSDFDVAAIKIGMLYDADIIRLISDIIAPLDIPIVLDPVCVSKAGASLLREDAIKALYDLSRIVTLTTPNLHEAYQLFGYKSGDTDSLRTLIEHPAPILIKHHVMENITADLLYFAHQKRVFTSDLIDSTSQHGTGCSYSSAIAANLALGHSLEESIERSKRFITEAIRRAPSIGQGRGPINHKAGESMLLRGLYAITDEMLTPKESILRQVEEALEAGIELLQFRDKTSKDEEIETLTLHLLHLCRLHNVPFIIDDRPHLAQKIGADGLHIGKDDMSLREAKAIFTKGFIGVSCYGSIKKALEAQEEGADYVAFGSFFPSPTKPHSGIVGMSVLEKAKEALTLPICAIGGINITNIHEIGAYHPEMISVVSAVWEGNIKRNIMQLKQGMSL